MLAVERAVRIQSYTDGEVGGWADSWHCARRDQPGPPGEAIVT
jgi:hypothetical protein